MIESAKTYSERREHPPLLDALRRHKALVDALERFGGSSFSRTLPLGASSR